jgi:hypothetical protein
MLRGGEVINSGSDTCIMEPHVMCMKSDLYLGPGYVSRIVFNNSFI